MKKFFQITGLISLICFSFFYTEKTVDVTKNLDNLMIEIKEKEGLYKQDEKNAIINGNTIIPGISGLKVDIDKSYEALKKIGYFDSKKLVFKKIQPNISLKKNLNKYIISGNKEKKMVSLIFMVDKNTDITEILKILDKNNIKGNFFVDEKYFEDNNDLIINLINAGHIIGNLSNNKNYSDSAFVFMKTIITSLGKQKNNYCFLEEENEEYLNICALQKSLTIKSKIINKQPLIETKNIVNKGSLLVYEINNELNLQLEFIISYLRQKGYIIETIEEHLEE